MIAVSAQSSSVHVVWRTKINRDNRELMNIALSFRGREAPIVILKRKEASALLPIKVVRYGVGFVGALPGQVAVITAGYTDDAEPHVVARV